MDTNTDKEAQAIAAFAELLDAAEELLTGISDDDNRGGLLRRNTTAKADRLRRALQIFTREQPK